jgi:PhoH-like ATPase
MTAKRFVLDTNVLLHDPKAVDHFADNEVVVPIYAIEEIDRFKRELSERGRNARVVSRYLDSMRGLGRLSDGVATKAGGRLRVAMTHSEAPQARQLPEATADDLILALALQEQQRAPGPVIFVTKDVNLRIRADALGLLVENYTDEKVDITELYSGAAEISVPGTDVDRLYADGKLPWDGEREELVAHQYVVLKDDANAAHSALGRFDVAQKTVQQVRRLREGVWGIKPRNKEQHFALDLLLNDEVKLITLVGKAGTGKTLLAIAAGLHQVIEERKFHKLLVSRPIFPLGRDIGFLPGDLEQKLNPWMQPIYDNLELLVSGPATQKPERGATERDRKNGGTGSYSELIDMGYIQVEPLTYIRGRSIPNQFMIVDEAQNLTPHEVKTIITRVGDNTKIILTGDPYQIDNPYVDSANNGLTVVVERFKQERLAGHITLFKGERSELAELAANIL